MDFSKFKSLKIGGVELKQLFINGIQVWKAVSYTNQIPISVDASGNIYNGKGFKANTYINAGNEGESSGKYATGYIPCKIGDIIRFKNMTFTATNASRITFFDENKTYIGQSNGNSSYNMDTRFQGVKDSNGNYIQLNIVKEAGLTEGAQWIRIHCPSITTDSIITINEEID